MTCCESCSRGGACAAHTRIGGTHIGFPARVSVTRIKPGIVRGKAGVKSGLGASFWDRFASDYQPGSFTEAMSAGWAGPADVSQAMSNFGADISSLPSLEVNIPGIEYGGSSVSEIVASMKPEGFTIPTPSIGWGGSSGGLSGGIGGWIAGIAVAAVGLFAWKRHRAAKAAKSS